MAGGNPNNDETKEEGDAKEEEEESSSSENDSRHVSGTRNLRRDEEGERQNRRQRTIKDRRRLSNLLPRYPRPTGL